MGAAAVAADVGGVCLPLALGSAVGASCSAAHDRCGQRMCIVEGTPASWTEAPCMPVRASFTVAVTMHSVEVVQGVVGSLIDNEPILAVRARALPFVQAVGRRVPVRTGSSAAAAGNSKASVLGEMPVFHRYTFGDLQATLPDLSEKDAVIVAFGTRTVLRVLGAVNAPLDFASLGSIGLELGRLLERPQPVEILVPITPHGESLPQVVRASISFRVSGITGGQQQTQMASLAPVLGTEVQAITPCITADIDQEIRSLENQLHVLKLLSLNKLAREDNCS